MKVIITGGNGFFARYCVEELVQNNCKPILLTRNIGKYKDYDYIVTDYNKDGLTTIFSEHKADAIVHLAGPRKAYPQITDYNDYFDMTTAIYEAASDLDIKNIVFASSISVYAGNSIPYREDQKVVPENNYGLSKIVCEEIGNIFCRTKGLCIKNLRFAHLYGANENNMYMINKFFKQAFSHEQLFVNCISVAKREMLYAKDAAEAVLCALQRSSLSGTYNIGSGDFLTNEEIAEAICKCMSPENKVLVGKEAETIKSSYMDSNKAYEELGYRANYTLNLALPEIYRDMIRNVGNK